MSNQQRGPSKMFKAQIVPIKWGKNKGRFGWVVCTPEVVYRSGTTFRTEELAVADAVGNHNLKVA